MQTAVVNLVNSGNTEFNDTVYRAKTFDLVANDYTFLIQPNSSYWRFGLVLSQTPDFDFEPQNGRYANTALKFLHLNAGDQIQGNAWTASNKLELTSYYLEPGILQRFDKYEERTPLNLRVHFDPNTNIISCTVFPANSTNTLLYAAVTLPFYTYFRIFAWADFIEFSIDCTITETEKPQMAVDPASPTLAPTHWLLKIREQTWDIQDFIVGQGTWFTTYTLSSGKRPEYDLYLSLKPGDLLLAYAYENYHAVVGIMTVTEAAHTDFGKGEVVGMAITELFDPYIPVETFYPGIAAGDQLSDGHPNRLVPLTDAEYAQILGQKKSKAADQFWLPAFSPEGNHLNTQDQLDFTYDILAFAKVIALENVKPPLAIGLFGNWGSGKSFFMEKLNTEINTLKGSDPRYVNKVVQVTFNSWHYSDANLWASLITEIFDKLYEFSKNEGKQDELEKLSQTLQLTTIHKEETEAKRRELEQKQAQLEREQQNNRDRLKDISGLQLVRVILKDPRIQDDLNQLDNRNIETIFNENAKINSYIAELEKDKNKWFYFFRTLFEVKGRWIWVILAAVVILILSLSVSQIDLFGRVWNQLTTRIAGFIVFVTTFATTAWKAYLPVRKNLQLAYDRLTSLKKTIDSRPIQESKELADVRRELQDLKTSLESLDEQIKQTSTELDEIRTGKKLLEFIQQRSRDEQYSRQLGLISWIRKDFNKLDDLLRKQYQLTESERKEINPANVQLKIDRIILYIDDLDRCSEEIVIRVLEAVNLLLAFELFVVVVGVDPRWLKESLEKKYTFFKDQAVSSFEYLEKIFQIPFTLKPITQKNREDLLAYLIKDELQAGPPATGGIIGGASPGPAQASSAVPVGGSQPVQPGSSPVSPASTPASPVDPAAASPSGTPSTPAPPLEPVEESLVFTADELAIMKEVSVLFGHTPRTVKRFVNIYRIIKSHRHFEPSDNPRPTLLLLAIVVGCPEHIHAFITRLSQRTDLALGIFLEETEELKHLKSWLAQHINESNWSGISINAIKRNLELVSRFSFRTGWLLV
jgi:hypothetical protein